MTEGLSDSGSRLCFKPLSHFKMDFYEIPCMFACSCTCCRGAIKVFTQQREDVCAGSHNFKGLFIGFKIKFLFGLGQLTIECMKSMRVLTMMEMQVRVDEISETD